jgi:transposase
MGLDQHRAQISAEWIDTITGEVSRARIMPADRAAVRKFLARFAGEGLEVALEATTGWRFVVEELERVAAEVHLAEPAEAAALKGKKKRAKTDWADARHLRELLLIGRVPESWIPPVHILDLRARVRTRHLLSHQRTEWQQRIHSVLYHHGVPQQRNLLTSEKREWLAALKLPAAAREQITIALSVIDALDLKLNPFDQDLRAYARKQPGCRTLADQIYGVGGLTAVTILAEFATPAASATPATSCATPGWTSPSTNPTITARPGTSPVKDHPHCAGRCTRQPNAHGSPPATTDRTTSSSPHGSAGTAPAWRWRASCSNAATTSSKPSATRRSRPSPDPRCRAASPRSTDEPRPAPGETAPDPPRRGRPRKNERPQHHLPEQSR